MNRNDIITPILRPAIALRSQAGSDSSHTEGSPDVGGHGNRIGGDDSLRNASRPRTTRGDGAAALNSPASNPFIASAPQYASAPDRAIDRPADAGTNDAAAGSFFDSAAPWSSDYVRRGELIEAVRGIENKSTGGFTKFLVLVVSLMVFVAAGVAFWNPWLIGMLVIVLLFHEAGHYVAMRLFGYCNVKMFFIPFLGAAVSGRHFNIAGWKKALVYLAGPVPGIFVSFPLMVAGTAMEADWMFELGVMALLLNTLNLLPIMPLDGGWIMHLTVFSRSPFLELVARVAGVVVMAAFAFF